MEITMKPIGYISSPYLDVSEIPRQSVLSEKEGEIKLEEEFREGISGYKVGDQIVILFCFHMSPGHKMIIKPHGGDQEMGVFKTRSPNRPNPIGMSIVKITRIEDGKICFKGVDMLDSTPVLDIKPYSAALNPETSGR